MVFLAGLIGAALYVWLHLKKRTAAQTVAASWRDYETAARKYDVPAMQEALDQILAADPSDPTANRFKAILDRGESDPDTIALAVVLLHYHVQGDRLPAAAREADRVLAKFPKYWLARCVQIHAAIQLQRDLERAQQLIEQLPDPEDPDAGVTAGGVLYALRLSDLLGRNSVAFRKLIVSHLAPLVRSGSAASASPGAKAQLIECYLEPFADAGSLAELSAFWASADRLTEAAVNEAVAAADGPSLKRLAALGPRMRVALALLRQHDPLRLPDDRFKLLLKGIDDRTRLAWRTLREMAPDSSDAYRGLAVLAIQEGNPREAVQQLLDGLVACGDRAELLEMLLPLVARFGTDESIGVVAAGTWAAAEAARTDPVKWCLAAIAQEVIGRQDRALEACARARAIQSAFPFACLTEARLQLRAGNFSRALEAIAPLGEEARRADPNLARLYSRALVGLNRQPELEAELRVLTERAKARPRSAAPAVACLLGVLDAPPDFDRTAWVDARLTILLADVPTAPFAGRLRAETRYRLAELTVKPHPNTDGSPPVWDSARVVAALQAIGQLTPEERGELTAIAALATLQLKGQGNAAAAMKAVTPLLAAEASLGAPQLEILGAVLTANDRAAAAVPVLERATRLPGRTAGCWVALAHAYRKNNQPLDARRALARAVEIPDRSPREQAEYIAAKLLFQQENP